MNLTRLSFLLFSSLLTSLCVSAQQFGGNPSRIKWYQVNTDTARVIYPKGLDSTAFRVASVVHNLQRSHAGSIGNRVRKVNIVLQNQPTISNAYVALAPYRSEFYLTPPQNSFELGSLNWADNLAVHEYRHIQQYSNFNVGLSKVASVILGQEGQAVANAASVPDWFFEGDAVFNETLLSNNGRGRLPDFFNAYKALNISGRKYSFMKLRNGSLRDLVPGHYELGYLLVAYGREKYGADFWQKVTHDAASFKPLFYPLQGAVKRHAGIPYKQFVADAFDFYQKQWKEQTNAPSFITPVSKNNVTDYRYPYATTDGNLVVLKRSYRQVPSFYLLPQDGTEKKIATRDIANDDYFSYNNGRIVYSSLSPDERWGYQEFSNIRIIDVSTGQRRKLTIRSRLFAPDISHNGDKIVAVRLATNQTSSVVLLNSDGSNERVLATSSDNVFTYPKFSTDDQFVYTATRNKVGEMALQKFDVSSGVVTNLLAFSKRIIGFPVVQGDTIFFSSSYKGHDESWAYVEKAAKVFRVASLATGIYQAVYDRQRGAVVGSVYTIEGYRLATFGAKAGWTAVDLSADALPELYVSKALSQDDNNTLENIPFRNFKQSRYRKATGLLNFHSWRPYYDDPEFTLTAYSQNILNTLQAELYYAYNQNELSHKVGLNAVYGGWYVQPVIGASQTWQRQVRYNADTSFFYNELNALAGLQLPLNFTGGRQYRSLFLSTTFNTQRVNWTGLGKRLLNNQSFNYLSARLVYSGQVQKATQHIYPHWAQTIQLQYRTILNKYTANQFLASGSVFLPGLAASHNIVLSAAYHARDTMNQYLFSNNFPFSRGYTAIDFPRMWRLGVNYHLPLLYPDWGFANLVYFKRIRANAFYDQTQTKSLRTGTKFFFGTTGGEVYFDTRWWNQQEVTFGIRYSRLLDREYRGVTAPNQWEFILPVNLFSN